MPAALAIALVWTRRSPAGAWYVTAISLRLVLGAALYYAGAVPRARLLLA